MLDTGLELERCYHSFRTGWKNLLHLQVGLSKSERNYCMTRHELWPLGDWVEYSLCEDVFHLGPEKSCFIAVFSIPLQF